MNNFASLIAESTPPPSNLIVDIVINVLPWAIIGVFFYFVFFKILKKTTRRTEDHMAAGRAHMAAVEAKLDRMISLLEQNASK